MSDYLVFTIDKFTFRTATDRYYSNEGLWVKVEGNQARIGVSDFLQQRSGDVAFIELKPPGTQVIAGDEIVVIETIKVNISLSAPVSGVITQVNPAMETFPELINKDPYEEGWIMLIEAKDLAAEIKHLLTPQAYDQKIKSEAEQEMGKE